MQQFNFPFCEEYSHFLEFKTSVIKHFDGSEQRQALWMNPKRSFSLNFEANSELKSSLQEFFTLLKGDCSDFLWRWDAVSFGSQLDYECFFDTSKLTQAVFPFSYSKIPITLATIEDGNILKGRRFLDSSFWQVWGNVSFLPQKACYNGASALFQQNILEPGKLYRLKVKTQDIQGLPPVLRADCGACSSGDSNFYNGVKTIDFIALSPDLAFEMREGTSGTFCEVSLSRISESPYPFDFEPNVEYQNELIFSSFKDEEFTYNFARANISENPIRRWFFAFELAPEDAWRFEQFFISKRGRYKAFEWNDGNENILVRFDSDKLEQKQFPLGYREIKIPIIEVLQ